MRIKQIVMLLCIVSIAIGYGCKAKKCASYEGDGAKHHVNYSKQGLVKKKQKSPSRSWGGY